MPKIPTYTTQGRPTAEVGSIKSNVQVPLTTALTSVQSAVANYYIREKQEEAKVKSSEYENESWNELYNIYDKYKNNPYPTDATSGFLKDTESYKQNFLNTTLANESNFTKKAWLAKFESNSGSTLVALNKSSRKNLDNKQEEEFKNFGSSLSTRIRLDDSFLATADAEIDNYVLKFPDEFVREEKRKEAFKIKNATIVDKQSRLNPVEFLNQLKKNPELYSNVPEEKEKAIKYAQTIIEEGNDKYVKDVITNVISQTPFGQQADTISTIEVEINKFILDPKKRTKALNDAQTAFDEKIKIITEKGGAEYFITNDSKINLDYQESIKDPTKFKIFSEGLDKLYDKQNIDNKYRTYLPNNKIVEIDAMIKASNGPDKKLQVINDLKSFYGDSMPSINKQINKQIGRGVSLAIETTDKELQAFAIQGPLDEKKKNYVKGITEGNNLEINLIKKINKNLSPLANIIANQPEGFKTYGQFMESTVTGLKDAAMNAIFDDKYNNASNASDGVSQKYLNDYNVTNDTFYIPYGVGEKPVNQDIIEAKANIFAQQLYWNNKLLDNFNVDPVGEGGKFLSKKESIDFFRKNGEWYMDGSTKIKFGVKESFGGFTPMTINKQNVVINFLDYDGEFKSMKDINGNNYVMDMKDIYSYINADFEGQQVP